MTTLYWAFDGYVISCGYQHFGGTRTPFSTRNLGTVSTTYQTALCRNQENCETNIYSHGNLKSYIH
jgi:hypothetical protein